MSDSKADYQELRAFLEKRFDAVTVEPNVDGMPVLFVSADNYVEIVKALRADADWRFNLLSHLFGTHRPKSEKPFAVNVVLTSITRQTRLMVRLDLPADAPTAPSLAAFWRAANWHERETYDMYGIVFDGHPDPRRIFLEEDADFHPLRKDYPVEGRGK